MVLQGDTDEEVSGYDGIIPLAARTQQGFDALVKSIQAAPGTPSLTSLTHNFTGQYPAKLLAGADSMIEDVLVLSTARTLMKKTENLHLAAGLLLLSTAPIAFFQGLPGAALHASKGLQAYLHGYICMLCQRLQCPSITVY